MGRIHIQCTSSSATSDTSFPSPSRLASLSLIQISRCYFPYLRPSRSRNNNPLSTQPPTFLFPMPRPRYDSANSDLTSTSRAHLAPRSSKLPQASLRSSTIISSSDSDSEDSSPSSSNGKIAINISTFEDEQLGDYIHSPLDPHHPTLICMTRWYIFLTFRYRRDSYKSSPYNDV